MNPTLSFPDGLTPESFLRDYWQRKPLLLRQVLPGFECSLEPEELAGLACEEGVESRLVLEQGGALPWEVRHGPFDEAAFQSLPSSHWTLLVQDVDKHLPAVAALLDHFRFLPDWRLDDVMVSYATDQGSVGPHTDEYDVFLFQAAGRRHWKIHQRPVAADDFIPGLDLRILPEFEAEQEWLLEPGDMLYLPPNVAHWGVAEGECMTCSVGFRAPTLRELATAWCDDLLEHRNPTGRYRDTKLQLQPASAEITAETLQQLHELLSTLLRDDPDRQRRWFGRFMTETKQNLLVEPPPQSLQPLEFINRYRTKGIIHRNSYSRLAFSRGSKGWDSLFANGDEYPIPSDAGDFLPVITHYRELHFGYLGPWLEQTVYLQLVCDLYNDGHFLFANE